MQQSSESELKIAELKKEGNSRFVERNFSASVQLYSEAIQLDATNHILFGNRSAAYLNLGKYSLALEDACKAIALQPAWEKGHFRKAMTLEALQKYREAEKAYSNVLKYNAKNKPAKQKLDRMKKLADLHDRTTKIESREHWKQVYCGISDVRLRLAVLVLFWNRATKTERYSIFFRFLQVLAESETVNIDDYSVDQMRDLPTEVYDDIVLPESWMNYFEGLDLPKRVNVFEDMFSAASSQEKTLIINDLKTFMANSSSVELESIDDIDVSVK